MFYIDEACSQSCSFRASYQTCSHGTACNFIHCFRNPGGDYEWADSDKPPPKFWVEKIIALFGYSDYYETSREQGNLSLSKTDSDRCAFT